MRILITAGPTREYLDDVRYLSNASSGLMGYALTAAALAAGHEVVLVSGPVGLTPPAGCEFHAVESSQAMYDACCQAFPGCQGVIAAAAVCDYTPARRISGKIGKTGQPLLLELVETLDVVGELGKRKGSRWVVGFALEADPADGRSRAFRKLEAKHCDAIVLNGPAAIGAAHNRVELIDKSGRTVAEWEADKPAVAQWLIDWIERNIGNG